MKFAAIVLWPAYVKAAKSALLSVAGRPVKPKTSIQRAVIVRHKKSD
jgi:hypothetical protein